jgi:argininosuccinate lyase
VTPDTPRPLWSGRFAGSLDPKIRAFTASLELDKRLALHDLRGSIAHARMLGRQRIIGADEATTIIAALEAMAAEVASGAFAWPDDAEDVHAAVEATLTARVGPVGGKLHTARSRNDQIALDLRLLVIELLDELDRSVKRLAQVLVERAEAEV